MVISQLSPFEILICSSISGVLIGLLTNYIKTRNSTPWDSKKSIQRLFQKCSDHQDYRSCDLPDHDLFKDSKFLMAGELDAKHLSDHYVNFPDVFEIVELLLRYCQYRLFSDLKRLYK
ncbi:hypothetical protein MJH12_13800, partial [bacterium]|nr:hypothetical protein [bacterium]